LLVPLKWEAPAFRHGVIHNLFLLLRSNNHAF
jgi:hypothetical protein